MNSKTILILDCSISMLSYTKQVKDALSGLEFDSIISFGQVVSATKDCISYMEHWKPSHYETLGEKLPSALETELEAYSSGASTYYNVIFVTDGELDDRPEFLTSMSKCKLEGYMLNVIGVMVGRNASIQTFVTLARYTNFGLPFSVIADKDDCEGKIAQHIASLKVTGHSTKLVKLPIAEDFIGDSANLNVSRFKAALTLLSYASPLDCHTLSIKKDFIRSLFAIQPLKNLRNLLTKVQSLVVEGANEDKIESMTKLLASSSITSSTGPPTMEAIDSRWGPQDNWFTIDNVDIRILYGNEPTFSKAYNSFIATGCSSGTQLVFVEDKHTFFTVYLVHRELENFIFTIETVAHKISYNIKNGFGCIWSGENGDLMVTPNEGATIQKLVNAVGSGSMKFTISYPRQGDAWVSEQPGTTEVDSSSRSLGFFASAAAQYENSGTTVVDSSWIGRDNFDDDDGAYSGRDKFCLNDFDGKSKEPRAVQRGILVESSKKASQALCTTKGETTTLDGTTMHIDIFMQDYSTDGWEVISDRSLITRRGKVLRRSTCLVCLENPSIYFYDRCGHIVICNECFPKGDVGSRCIYCRQEGNLEMYVCGYGDKITEI